MAKVQNGTDLVNKSGSTLCDIVNSVKRVTDIVAEIAAASKEQLTGVEQVNKAVSQMDRVTQSNAAQTEEMSGTASMLLSHSQQLSDLVNRFQLDGDEPSRARRDNSKAASQAASHISERVRPASSTNVVPVSYSAGFDAPNVLEF